jgi:hypothetical protein
VAGRSDIQAESQRKALRGSQPLTVRGTCKNQKRAVTLGAVVMTDHTQLLSGPLGVSSMDSPHTRNI